MFLVDANVFLELELDQNKADECENILKKFLNGKLKGITTDFLVDGIVIVMENYEKGPDDIKLFLSSLLGYKGLGVYDLTLIDKISAIEYMRTYGLNFDDATTFQAMKVNKIKQIISYDSDFDNIEGIDRVLPAEIS